MQVTVKHDTWLPAQTALVEVDVPQDGLFICTSDRVDAWPRMVKKGIDKVRCIIRGERAPITLYAGEVIGEVISLPGEVRDIGIERDSGTTEGAGEHKAISRSNRRLAKGS